MKVILFEYMTSGALSQQQSLPRITTEGELMVQAVGRMLSAIDDVSLVTLRDSRLSQPAFDTRVITVGPNDDFRAILSSQLDSASAFLPIAPETNGALSALCRLGESKGCLVLNPSSLAVEQFTKKLETYHYLTSHRISCVPTMPFAEVDFPQATAMVVKPNDGVGCENTFLIPAGEVPDRNGLETVCQPFIEGITASMGIIYAPQKTCLVAVNKQNIHITTDNGFELTSCQVNGLLEYRDKAYTVACAIHQACPDLRGYVGVDFMITDNTLSILEVNPRITTSFAGLPESIEANPCQLILAAVQGKVFQCPTRYKAVEVVPNG